MPSLTGASEKSLSIAMLLLKDRGDRIAPVRVLSVRTPRPTGDIRPLSPIGGQRCSVVGAEGKRTPPCNAPDAGRLPSAYNGIQHRRHTAEQGPATSPGKIPGVAELKNVGDIEGREASFQPWL